MTSRTRQPRRVHELALVIAFLFTLAGPAMATDAQSFFKLVDALVYNSRQSPEVVGRGLGVALARSEATSNEVSTVYEGGVSAATPLIRSVTLRLTNPGQQQDNLIALVLDDSALCLTSREVSARYGSGYQLDVPTPRQPRTAPLFQTYRYEWGALRFGFSRQEGKCLQQVRVEFPAR